MSTAPSQLGAFTRSAPALAWPDLQYHVQPLSLDAFGEPPHPFDAFTANVCNLTLRSHGHVRIASPDPAQPPSICTNDLSTEHDRRVATESLRLARRIVDMPALAPYQPQEFRPGVQFQSDKEPVRLADDIGTPIFHPVGTCRMGRTDDEHAVVNTRLRLCGLHVADASVMLTIACGSTNSPMLVIGVRRPLNAARDTVGHIEPGKYRCRNARNCLHCADSQRRRLLGRR
jgi:choline dehydrogenase